MSNSDSAKKFLNGHNGVLRFKGSHSKKLPSVDTEMCCPKGKCGYQYFLLLTEKKKIHGLIILLGCCVKCYQSRRYGIL
jgi:hypothetical protein